MTDPAPSRPPAARRPALRSPLQMAMREPEVDALVHYLAETRDRIEAAPGAPFELAFSRAHLERVRGAFADGIRRGEAKLHRLCELLGGTLLGGSYDMQSVVIGEVPATRERFTLVQRLGVETMYASTDLDLGNRVLGRVRLLDGDGWAQPQLVANFVEYHPHADNAFAIHKMISRIKAEEEIWNKVVDEIFDLDALVRRDKELRAMSFFVKDIFGVKMVVGDEAAARRLLARLGELRWSGEELARARVPHAPSSAALELVEVKDYLSDEHQKRSGWAALKAVVAWWDATFEVQIQPLGNYFREREKFTEESHDGFKRRRESLRDRVAETTPLFGFYRDLLRWLFLDEGRGEAPPALDRVTVRVAA